MLWKRPFQFCVLSTLAAPWPSAVSAASGCLVPTWPELGSEPTGTVPGLGREQTGGRYNCPDQDQLSVSMHASVPEPHGALERPCRAWFLKGSGGTPGRLHRHCPQESRTAARAPGPSPAFGLCRFLVRPLLVFTLEGSVESGCGLPQAVLSLGSSLPALGLAQGLD